MIDLFKQVAIRHPQTSTPSAPDAEAWCEERLDSSDGYLYFASAFDDYVTWCARNGKPAGSKMWLGRFFTRNSIGRVMREGRSSLVGLSLRTQQPPDEI